MLWILHVIVILMQRIGGILDLGQLGVDCHLSTSPAVCSKNNKELQYTRLLSELVGRRIVRLEMLFSRSEVDK